MPPDDAPEAKAQEGVQAPDGAKEAAGDAGASGEEKLSLLDRSRIMRDVVTVLAISIAGVWALVTFWYNSSYLPKHEKPLVTSTMTLSVMGEKDGKVAVNAHLVLRNEGKAKRETWGLTFHAIGSKVSFGGAPDGGPRTVLEPNDATYAMARDYAKTDEVLLASNVDLMLQPGRSNAILPHAELAFDFDFYADRAAVDEVEVMVAVIYPDSEVSPKEDWFKVDKTGKLVAIRPTPACMADPACKQTVSTVFSRTLSLWKR